MTHRADTRAFLDERGSHRVTLCPNGLNPATLLEKPVRERIIESFFFKDQCFGINEADVVDRCVAHVRFVGGTYGSAQKPTPFLCLAFKLLQLAPGDDVVREYLGFGGERFKYLRALAVFYVRLTRRAEDVYKTLEPLLEDRRKLRRKGRMGTTLTYVDQFVDDLLTKDRVCGTSLWQMTKRELLEDLEKLEPRVSPLGDIEDLLEEDDEGQAVNGEEVEIQSNSDDEGEVEETANHDNGEKRRSISYERDDEMDIAETDDSPARRRRSRSRSDTSSQHRSR